MSREGEVVMGLRNPTRPTLQGGQRMREEIGRGFPRWQYKPATAMDRKWPRTTQAKNGHERNTNHPKD